jgi:hypothetical protein
MVHDVYGGHDDNPLTEVRVGMSVVDAEGAQLGVIAAVKMGDPGAISHRGQDAAAENGLVALVRDTFAGAEPHVAAESAGRLLRAGYVKIDRRRMLDRYVYAAADEIAGVTNDRVALAVCGDELTAEF